MAGQRFAKAPRGHTAQGTEASGSPPPTHLAAGAAATVPGRVRHARIQYLHGTAHIKCQLLETHQTCSVRGTRMGERARVPPLGVCAGWPRSRLWRTWQSPPAQHPRREEEVGHCRPARPGRQAGSAALTKKKWGNLKWVFTRCCSRRRQAKLSQLARRAREAAAGAEAAAVPRCAAAAFLEIVGPVFFPAAAAAPASAAAAAFPSVSEKVWREALTVMSSVSGAAKSSPKMATAVKHRAIPDARTAEREAQLPFRACPVIRL